MKQSRCQQLKPGLKIDYDQVLGRGSFGIVYKGELFIGQETIQVAIKIITGVEKKQIEECYLEIQLMKSANHKNILKLYEHFYEDGKLYLILEYCTRSLQDEIKEKKLTQWRIFQYMKQIKDGMLYMNEQKAMHRDLKPANILLDKFNVIKICDFGISKRIEDHQKNELYEHTSKKGTPLYMAPNVFSGKYSQKCDVFSLGAMIYHLLTGQQVYKLIKQHNSILYLHQDYQNLKQNKCQKLYGEQYHSFFKEFIENTVTYYENDRWNFSQLHQFVIQHQNEVKKNLAYEKMKKGQMSAVIKKQSILKTINIQKKISFVDSPNRIKQKEVKFMEGSYSANSVQNKVKSDKRWKSLESLQQYFQFVYNRAQQLITVAGINLDVENVFNLQTKYEQHVFVLIATKIHKTMLDQIIRLFDVKYITLPNGQLFDRTQLQRQKQCIQKYYQLIRAYRQPIISLRTKSIQKIKNLLYEIRSKFNINQQPRLKNFRNELSFIQSEQSQLSQELYQIYLKKFIRQINNYDIGSLKNDEIHTRVYWGMLKISCLDEMFPQTEFMNNQLFADFQEKYQKGSIEQIISQIEILKYGLEDWETEKYWYTQINQCYCSINIIIKKLFQITIRVSDHLKVTQHPPFLCRRTSALKSIRQLSIERYHTLKIAQVAFQG